MSVDKFTRLWANAGTKTAPTTGEQDAGWVDNAQVPFEWLNWLQDQVEAKCNEIIRERVNSFYDDATDWQAMIASGLWSDSWGNTNDDANVISSGGTKEIIDLVVYFNADGEARLLALDNSLLKIETWDPRDMSLESTSDALTDDLPSGGGETWVGRSMCTDNTSVYITFTDTNAAPDEHHIQAWTLATGAVKTGWPATGTVLPGTGSGVGAVGKVIVASATKLATANTWNTISAASSAAISLVNIVDGLITGGAAGSGSGDAPTGASAVPWYSLASDGTSVYFLAVDAATPNSYLATATLADPQVGNGGAGYPLTLATVTGGRIASCGPGMIVTAATYDPTEYTGETLVVLRAHSPSNAAGDLISFGLNSAATPLPAIQGILRYPLDLKFDGANLWILGTAFSDTGTTSHGVVVRVDVSTLSTYSTTAMELRQLEDVVSGVFRVSSETSVVDLSKIHLSFDGRDLWSTTDSRASQPTSGKIFRLPLALLRS